MSAPLTRRPHAGPLPSPAPVRRCAAGVSRSAPSARRSSDSARCAPRLVAAAADKRAADGRATDAAAAWRACRPAALARPLGARPSPAPPRRVRGAVRGGRPRGRDPGLARWRDVFRPARGFRSARLVSKENVRFPRRFAEFDGRRRASAGRTRCRATSSTATRPSPARCAASFAKTQDRKKTSRGRKTKP